MADGTMPTELELLKGIAEQHAKVRDTINDMRRASLSADYMRRGQLRRQLLAFQEQRDSLHELWRRSYAGKDAVATPISPAGNAA